MCHVRAKDAKMRECFEKLFPELKKQREDKERLLGLALVTCNCCCTVCYLIVEFPLILENPSI